ncbi:hypothetical protein COW20_13080, partial [bacterium (Candidatus Blackallbacteria) CG13_big_fil_rev_8_21_14_2_50_49_14]
MVAQEILLSQNEKKNLLTQIKKIGQALDKNEAILPGFDSSKYSESFQEIVLELNKLVAQVQDLHRPEPLDSETDLSIQLKNAAVSSVSTNIMIANPKFEIVYMNPAIVQMFKDAEHEIREVFKNFDPEKLMGMNIDVFHKNPAHQRKVLANLKGIFRSRISIGMRSFDLVAAKSENHEGETIGYVVEWTDITHRLVTESEKETLLTESLRIKSALDCVSNNLMIANPDFEIVYMNPAITQMFKNAQHEIREVFKDFNPEKLIGMNIDVFHKNPAHQRKVLESLKG